MRRLRRAYQKRNNKQNRKLRKGIISAGTAAAITLGSAGSFKTLAEAAPDEHQLIVNQDSDNDLLRDAEEFAIGYKPFVADQNGNGILDGIELAQRCAAVIDALPLYNPRGRARMPNETYKVEMLMYGEERCDICGENINMGGYQIFNPQLEIAFPDPNDPLESSFLPFLAIHYMSHGSFDCSGEIHTGRTDIARLLRILEIRFPYEPDEHQLVVAGRDTERDSDGDLLTDSEELAAGYNFSDPDQDENLVQDGIDLAKQCAEVIDALPIVSPDTAEIIHAIYKVSFIQRGLEHCQTCGAVVNMGYWQIHNAKLGLSIDVPEIVLHYMQEGSFTYAGDVHRRSRINVALLKKVLEMPQRCGDLGTIYEPADLNRDCRVDMNDISVFIDQWLIGQRIE